jgi:hypothetical protein
MLKYNNSPLWKSILKSELFTNFNILTFKNEGANNKIAQYNPKTHSILFLKNILFKMALEIPFKYFKLLNKIKNRDLGGGINIKYKNINCDLDYLLAINEFIFLEDLLKETNTILEIGAGYGRTCNTILSLTDNLKEYTIVDLPEMLNLSQIYLKNVLNKELFKKIKFISVNELKNMKVDLIINIDSMQEMHENVVLEYMKYININTKNFYCNNTVGKFSPELCGWEKSENSNMALSSGVLKNIINIFCPDELLKSQKQFMINFLPTKKWKTLKHSATMPWSHYYQAIFSK